MTADLDVVILLFPQVTALDAVGPYEVLQRIPSIDVTFASKQTGPVRTENGMLGLFADATIDEVGSPDVLIVPGGIGTRRLQEDHEVLEWVREVHRDTVVTTSVCTGSLVLAAAGLLGGLTATTHWSTYSELAALGAEPVPDRVVEHLDRRLVTAAGVSSGIDMALRLVELLVDRTAAEAAQLMIEYDPRPPFDCGSPAKVDDPIMTRAVEYASVRS